MKRQNEIFQVYNFEMTYWQDSAHQAMIRFYAVPIGAYVKPRRQTQTRETILREYADDIAEIYRRVLAESILSQTDEKIEVQTGAIISKRVD